MRLGRHIAAHVGYPNQNTTVADTDRLIQTNIRVIADFDVRRVMVSMQTLKRFFVKFLYLIEWGQA